jgi:hypothetical protein
MVSLLFAPGVSWFVSLLGVVTVTAVWKQK